MAPEPTKLSPTELRLLSALADGKLHPRDALLACLERGGRKALNVAIASLRRKLRPFGETILLHTDGPVIYYSWGRRLASPYDGRK